MTNTATILNNKALKTALHGLLLATAMGAATTTLMVVGGTIVKTIKTAQAKRAEAKALAELEEIEKNSTDANKVSIEDKLKTEKGLEELREIS